MNIRTMLFSVATILGVAALSSAGFAQTNSKPVAGGSYNQMKKDQRQAGIGPAPKGGMRPGAGQATSMAAPNSPAVPGGSYSQMKRDKDKAGLGPKKGALAQTRSSMRGKSKEPDDGMPGKTAP